MTSGPGPHRNRVEKELDLNEFGLAGALALGGAVLFFVLGPKLLGALHLVANRRLPTVEAPAAGWLLLPAGVLLAVLLWLLAPTALALFHARTRVRLVALPEERFSPTAGDVERVARRLAALRLPSPLGASTTIRLVEAGEGRCAYVLEIPRRLESPARAVLETFSGVTVQAADHLVQSHPLARWRSRCEMVLAQGAAWTLASPAVDLSGFTILYRDIRPQLGDRLEIAISFQGLGPLARSRALHRRRQTASTTVLARELVRAEIGISAASHERGREVDLVSSAANAWAVFDGDNQLRPLRALPFLHDLRMRWGLLSRRRRHQVVALTELAAWCAPPGAGAPCVLRAHEVRSPARGVEPFFGDPATLPLGVLSSSQQAVCFRPDDPAEFASMLVIGASGSGKSSLLATEAVHGIRSGQSVVLVDPHRTAAARALGFLDPAERSRVGVIDLETGGSLPSVNFLDVAGLDQDQVDERVLEARDVLMSCMVMPGWASRVRRILRRTLEAMTTLNRQLAAEDQMTLLEMENWLTDPDWRAQFLERLPPRSRGYWESGFKGEQNAAEPIVGLCEGIRTSRTLRRLLGRPRMDLDFGRYLHEGLSVFVLGGSSLEGQILSNLVTSLAVRAGRERIGRPELRPASILVDELPLLDTVLGGPLAASMRELRKAQVRTLLFSQDVTSLSRRTLRVVLGNRTVLLSSALSAHDARLLSAELGGAIGAPEIVNLGAHRFLCQVRRDAPFQVEALRPEVVYQPGSTRQVEPQITQRVIQEPGLEPLQESPEDGSIAVTGVTASRDIERTSSSDVTDVTAPVTAMNGERICALEGCDRPLQGRRFDARYCSEAHRKAASREGWRTRPES